MLKHVQISPLRNRSDSLSLRSSTSSASSICGSPEPPNELQRTPSRASSYSSLNETLPQTTIKVFTNCLRVDIEYKTLGIQWDTTSKEVITQLLRRLKMKHRDPRLFYLSMEVTVRRAGVKTVLVLEDEARPAILQACHPKGDSRFCLQLKPGGLIRVHTSALQSSSQYKSLVISQETTSDELLCILLSYYNSIEPVEQFSLYEVCPGQEYQRKLHPDDIPLKAQNERIQRGETCHFLVRRNPNYLRGHQILSSSLYTSPSLIATNKSIVIDKAKNNNEISNNIRIYHAYDNDINNDGNFKSKINDLSYKTKLLSNSRGNLALQNQEKESQILIPNNELKSGSCDEINSNINNNGKVDNMNQNDHGYFGGSTITSIKISTSAPLQSLLSSSSLSTSSTSDFSKEQDLSNLPKNENNNINFELNSIAIPNLKLHQNKQKEHQSKQKTFKFCPKCQRTLKFCESCNKNYTPMILNSSSHTITNNLDNLELSKNNNQHHQLKNLQVNSYSPVYNIREIRTASHSFSSLGNDKKMLDIDFGTHLIPFTTDLTTKNLKTSVDTNLQTTTLKVPIISSNVKNSNQKLTNTITIGKNPSSILTLMSSSTKETQNFNNPNNCTLKKDNIFMKSSSNEFKCPVNSANNLNRNTISIDQLMIQASQTNLENKITSNSTAEEVNNNPAKGLGHFVYI